MLEEVLAASEIQLNMCIEKGIYSFEDLMNLSLWERDTAYACHFQRQFGVHYHKAGVQYIKDGAKMPPINPDKEIGDAS